VFIGAFAYLSEGVKLGNNVKIFPHVYLGGAVSVGDNNIIHPGVKIYKECVIGKQVTIHAGTVIGSDGFGFAPQPDGSFKKVPQIGNVVIEDYVEIVAILIFILYLMDLLKYREIIKALADDRDFYKKLWKKAQGLEE